MIALAYLVHSNVAQACTTTGIRIPCRATGDRSPIDTAIKLAIGVAASLSVLFITIGAFRYTISQGDPANISKAKNTIIYALIGLVVSVTAYGIVTLVIERAGA